LLKLMSQASMPRQHRFSFTTGAAFIALIGLMCGPAFTGCESERQRRPAVQ
jgi:hypothetical protein